MDEQFHDRRLVKRLLAREDAAFRQFFDAYFQRLYRFAIVRLNDDPDATKYVVQGALSKAIQKLHTYRGEAALFTWLCAICRNELNDHLGQLARDREVLVFTEDFPEIRAAVDSLEAPSMDDPEANYRRTEAARLIQVALDRLPTHYGNALEWKYIYGLSVDEIAQKLDLGLEATQSILARAKTAFGDVYQSLTAALIVKDEATQS